MSKPSIDVYFSNAVENLAAKLSANIVATQSAPEHDLFDSVKVLVPNSNMGDFLKVSVMKHNGVCSNVEFPFFESGLWQAISELQPNKKYRLLDRNVLMQLIIVVLSAPNKNSVLSPFYDYVDENGTVSHRKLWQLSGRLATLFLEYQLNRPEMLSAWRIGRLVFNKHMSENLPALEQAQRALYLEVFSGTVREEYANDYLSLAEFFAQVQQIPSSSPSQSLHIFTPSRLSSAHRQLFVELAHHYHVHLYHLNMCSEYWEDASTNGEQLWLSKFQTLRPQNDEDNPSIYELPEDETLDNDLLKAWGKPGRENLKLYGDLEEDAAFFNIHFENTWLQDNDKSSVRDFSAQNSCDTLKVAAASSLLTHIQSDILLRTTTSIEHSVYSTPFNQQHATWLSSLQISQAPSIAREVDALYNNIRHNMTEDSTLQLSDIVVLTPDINKYRAAFEARFEAQASDYSCPIPYTLIDGNAATDSVYAHATTLLLKVIDDDFIRRDVFELFRNPCFQEACGITDKEIENWLNLCERAGIYRGYDDLYVGQAEIINPNQGLFTWHQGLKRLRLGTAVDFDSANSKINDLHPLGGATLQDVGKLSFLLARLNKQKSLFKLCLKPSEWGEKVTALLDEFLAIPEALICEESVKLSVAKSLDELRVLQANQMQLPFEDIRYVLEQCFANVSAFKGASSGRGVIIAALQPMRPIPFKITYILGLDEKSFPGALENDALDLRLKNRRIGDISRIENMQYLFLETLMCTRKKLYLSYVSQDLKKDAEILPSSVLNDMMAYLKAINVDFQSCHLALSAAHPSSFTYKDCAPYDFHLQYSFTEWLQALIIRNTTNIAPNWAALEKEISKLGVLSGRQQRYVALLKTQYIQNLCETDTLVQNDKTPQTKQVIQVDLKELVRLLENPLVASLAKQGIDISDAQDKSLVEDEPFALDNLDKWALFSNAVFEYLLPNNSSKSFASTLQSNYELAKECSLVALPTFVRLDDLTAISPTLTTHRNKLNNHIGDHDVVGSIVLGDAKSSTTALLQLPALTLALTDTTSVQINGCLENVRINYTKGAGGDSTILVIKSCTVATSAKAPNAKTPSKHLLLPFLFQCALQLMKPAMQNTGCKVAEDFEIHAVYMNRIVIVPLNELALLNSAALIEGQGCLSLHDHLQRYLCKLSTSYLAASHDYMPFSIAANVLANNDKSKAKTEQQRHERYLDEAETAWADEKYSNILKIISPTYPQDAIQKYQERFSLLFAAANVASDVKEGKK